MGIVKETERILSSDGKTQLYVSTWRDDSAVPKAVLQISHGMCEYVDRYDEFASFLAENGYIVCGNDHLGHGYSAAVPEDLGYIAEKDGYKLMVKDLRKVTELLSQRYPDLPIAMLGHSMGSFLARKYAADYSDGPSAYIFEGTDGSNPAGKAAEAIISVIQLFKGERYRSPLITKFSFGTYCDRIEDHPTGSEWVTSDPEKLKEYVSDPLCMYTFTLSAYRDLTRCLDEVLDKAWAPKLRKDIPYLLASGEDDPVGDYGEGVEKVYRMMRDAGCSLAEIRLYPGQRHELHNETQREKFYSDTLQWLNSSLGV
ncbi:MAG: lysophospholipase [Oscillospiraceae bacterium]|nr:lysophospholipase [Oscillospiraceae bacterium]